MVRRIIGLFVCTLAAPSPVRAQDVWLGAAVEHATHRFADAPETARLDGATAGLAVLGGVRVWRHVVARVEWSRDGQMTDRQSLTLNVAGRVVTIESTLTQRTRAFRTLGGFTHSPSSRVRLGYLIGAAFTHVERTFETNAPGLVLGGSAPEPSSLSTTEDQFAALAGGADVLVRLYGPIDALAGVRLQALKLDPALAGRRVTAFAGAVWVFR